MSYATHRQPGGKYVEQKTTMPSCKKHGLMVPTGTDFCFSPAADGLVTAIVAWDKPDREMVTYSYAPAGTELSLFSASTPDLGERIYELQQQNMLFSRRDLDSRLRRTYRIDDSRPGYNWTYLVSLDDFTDGPRLMARTVYHFEPDTDEHTYPALTDFDAVLALMEEPNTLVIDNIGKLYGQHFDENAEIRQRWALDNRVVVWDVGAVQRNVDALKH